MANTGGRSRRRLSFPPVQEQTEDELSNCALCSGYHTSLYEPQTWRNEQAQQIAKSLHIWPDKCICRLCKDDITRLVKNPSHTPRWEKKGGVKCCMPGCDVPSFTQSKIASQEQLNAISHTIGCSVPSNVPIPTPLCKHHYHLVYKTLQPKQSHCPTCGSSLRTTPARPCPDVPRILKYLQEKTGFEGELTENTKVCYACYKSHLQMLKEANTMSTNNDLLKLINSFEQSIIPVEALKCTEDVVNRSLAQTTLYVAESLYRQEALLLPSVHSAFSHYAAESIQAANLEFGGDVKQLVTARWLLSNLVSSLQHHLSYVCRVKKYGTLLYRTNGDILATLTTSLHKLSKSFHDNHDGHFGTQNLSLATPSNSQLVMDDLNSLVHQQIRKFLVADAREPYSFDKLEIDRLVSEMDPTLWSAISLLTRSISERRGTSRVSDTKTPTHHTKKVRRLFCLCALMYCTDDRCYLPLHNLITDTVDSLGGSALLIRILNRLGVCSSADTLARSIQYRVQEREKRGAEQECSPNSFTVISADNIDFLHSYARVFYGNQTRSWHGTTVQAVQPKPSFHVPPITEAIKALSMESEPAVPRKHCNIRTQSEPTQAMPITENSSTRHTECPTDDLAMRLVSRKRASDKRSPYSSPAKSTRSPAPKVRRRARTGLEDNWRTATASSSLPVSANISFQHFQSNKISLDDFKISQNEETAIKILQQQLNTYVAQKHIATSESHGDSEIHSTFLNTQDYMRVARPTTTETSSVVYLHVLDALSESKDTLMQILLDLHKRFITGQNKKWLVVVGDAKVYDVLQSLKHEYGDDLQWLFVYPGDWHLLKNYQLSLMKPYFDAGLKDLARASGYPTEAIQNCSKFKRTHCFLLEAWEALFSVMMELFLTTDAQMSSFIQDRVKEAFLKTKTGDSPPLNQIITTLHTAATDSGFHAQFSSFIAKLAASDCTWKFWVQFVFKDALAYIGLYLAIRSGDWDLRMVSIKMMAPIFSAFDHSTYQNLIAQNLADIQSLPQAVLNAFKMGGFVVSITGRAWHSVAVDEAHEMCINKDCKTSIVRPTPDYISRVANYIPLRTKCLQNLRNQIFPDENDHKADTTPTSFLTTNANDRKTATNVRAQISAIKSAGLLKIVESNRGLINPFSKKKATHEQEHDLSSFRDIGTAEFEKYISYYVLRQASIPLRRRKRRLATFSQRKPSKRQMSQLERDRKLVQKCLHKKLKWCKQTKKPVETLAEQYIPLPLAIASSDGSPLKGQKSYSTKAIETRYKESSPPVILNRLPQDWKPECSILEGMFIINTTPLGTHRTLTDYAQFLIRRFILPQFSKGSKEVHVIFDNPGRLQHTPKYFERLRRDAIAPVATGHTCDEFHSHKIIPPKWRENVLNCRLCKRNLVCFLTQYFLHNITRHLRQDNIFLVAGGFEGDIQDTAWFVSYGSRPQPNPAYTSNAEEADTRLWMHVKRTNASKILVLSPDTDIYNIGLPLQHGSGKDIVIQLSPFNSKELKYLHLSTFVTVLQNDPDLSAIPSQLIPQIFQTIFVATGCDYISFFSGIGKGTFLRYFYQHAEFISSGKDNLPGTLADVDIEGNKINSGFLAFLRLVGTVYFKKHSSGFSTTPDKHFNRFSNPNPLQQHCIWLDDIRQTIWDRVQFESEMIPSTEALYRHWRRTCWVLDMWKKADNNHMVLQPLANFGWKVTDESLTFDWDSESNMDAVRQRVIQLLKGCKCKTGCTTSRCGCRKKNKECSEGCECTNCSNTQSNTHTIIDNSEDTLMELSLEENFTENREQFLDDEVDEIMDYVFGEYPLSEEHESSEVEDNSELSEDNSEYFD